MRKVRRQAGRQVGRQDPSLLPSSRITASLRAGRAAEVKMMDDMTALLKKEQGDDEQQKEYCEAEFEKSAKGCT